MNADLIQQVLAALEREQVRYVVFGAVALALHGLPRATEDLDLFIAPERDNIERLKRALHHLTGRSTSTCSPDLASCTSSTTSSQSAWGLER